jgi:hypothetical protein
MYIGSVVNAHEDNLMPNAVRPLDNALIVQTVTYASTGDGDDSNGDDEKDESVDNQPDSIVKPLSREPAAMQKEIVEAESIEQDDEVDENENKEDNQGRSLRRTRSRGGVRAKSSIDSTNFNIALIIKGSMTDAQKEGFTFAKAKWTSVITKDFASTLCIKAGTKMCNNQYVFPKDTCIDDLYIIAQIKPIDGVGKM